MWSSSMPPQLSVQMAGHYEVCFRRPSLAKLAAGGTVILPECLKLPSILSITESIRTIWLHTCVACVANHLVASLSRSTIMHLCKINFEHVWHVIRHNPPMNDCPSSSLVQPSTGLPACPNHHVKSTSGNREAVRVSHAYVGTEWTRNVNTANNTANSWTSARPNNCHYCVVFIPNSIMNNCWTLLWAMPFLLSWQHSVQYCHTIGWHVYCHVCRVLVLSA